MQNISKKKGKKVVGIYKIVNCKNNKIYIGSSANIYERFKAHKRKLTNDCHYNNLLQKEWNEYGEDSFIFSIIEECNVNYLLEREKYYISLYDTLNQKHGYNLAPIVKTDGKLKQYIPKNKLDERIIFVIKLLLLYGIKVTSISRKFKINSNTIYQIRMDKVYQEIVPDVNFGNYTFQDAWNEWQLYNYGFDNTFLIMNIRRLIMDYFAYIGYSDNWYIKEWEMNNIELLA